MPHAYGPHSREEARPLPAALVRQRAHINAIAHHGRLSRGPCRTCGRDEWDCPVRPHAARPDVHDYEPSR